MLDGFTKTVVEVETSEGVTGIGQAPSYAAVAILFSGHNVDRGKAVAYGAPDALVSDMAGLGGFSAMMRFVSACEGVGVDFWCYSGESGLGTAAYLHACAAHPHIREPHQLLFRQQPYDVILEGPFGPPKNHVALSTGPGLGVTLDRDRLACCAWSLQDRGVPNKYHGPDAPGVMRRMPRVQVKKKPPERAAPGALKIGSLVTRHTFFKSCSGCP